MTRHKAFTLVELLVVIAVIALLMAILLTTLPKMRERGKRIVCLSNLRQLTIAWTMYAQVNDEKLVNGGPIAPGGPCPASMDCPPGTDCAAIPPTTIMTADAFRNFHINELPWVGKAWGSFTTGVAAPECCQKCAIRTGALWKYARNEKIYRCPTGKKDELVTYAIIDSMNGKYMYSGCSGASPVPPNLCLKSIPQIKKPYDRFVFLDEGFLTPDSYAVNYACQKWFDVPMIRHSRGTNASFADGHAARLMYRADETIQAGLKNTFNFVPTTCTGKNDLYNMQIRCWGQIGYSPDPACHYSLYE
jgi:prepilin-type N-terminal cleavage/methylation domain-containing protein/prepilin-type processing-associated H-X9-DG protein